MNWLDFFSIVERDRDILNPISPAKLDLVAQYANLKAGDRVLDLCCGKGAMLRQWAAHTAIQGTGVDLNATFLEEAREHAELAQLTARLSFLDGDVTQLPPNLEGHEVVTCLGATFAFGGFAETLSWMQRVLKPGGSLAVGEVYLRTGDTADDLEREGWAGLQPLAALHDQIEAAGLDLVGLVTSSQDDWEWYSSLMWKGVHDWASHNPNHPDRAEVLAKTREGRRAYLSWQREHVGWAVLVARPALA